MMIVKPLSGVYLLRRFMPHTGVTCPQEIDDDMG